MTCTAPAMCLCAMRAWRVRANGVSKRYSFYSDIWRLARHLITSATSNVIWCFLAVATSGCSWLSVMARRLGFDFEFGGLAVARWTACEPGLPSTRHKLHSTGQHSPLMPSATNQRATDACIQAATSHLHPMVGKTYVNLGFCLLGLTGYVKDHWSLNDSACLHNSAHLRTFVASKSGSWRPCGTLPLHAAHMI